MNLYKKLYCRMYYWYNTNGKKDKDTLRISAFALLSALPCINLLSILFFLSILNHHTPLNKWVCVLVYILLFFLQTILISQNSSDELIKEYNKVILKDRHSYKKLNTIFYLYLIISFSLLIILLILIIFIKSQNGNYDI
jgi:membrane protein insertase Oxa1/YidC/SpoIIIJ